MLKPDFVMCDTALHLQPHLIFSPDGFKIEHSDCDSCEDDKTIALCWDVCDIISINSQWTQSVCNSLYFLFVTFRSNLYSLISVTLLTRLYLPL